jgi:hypothetical protein
LPDPPEDLQERFKTGEVLELEFKLIHGNKAWDPRDPAQEPERAELIDKAKKHSPENDTVEAERLVLHAWSVRNLPGRQRSVSPVAAFGAPPLYLGPVRKLSNRLLIELYMGLQPSFHTIYCGGDRYRTDPREVFGGGALS